MTSLMSGGKSIALALTVAVFAASWIAPLWPAEQALHSSLTVVGLIWLWRHDRRWPMLTWQFALICAFICVHSVAARWLYSNVPYDQWIQALTGWSLQSAFDTLLAEYDVAPEQLEADLLALVDELAQAGLVKVG